MPRLLNVDVSIYQAGNTWSTTRSIRLKGGLYKDVPDLVGEAHAAVIAKQIQVIMRLGDRGEISISTSIDGTDVVVPDALAKLARTAYERASR